MIKPYPKIFALGTSYVQDIFSGSVEVTEKLDGSQFGFGKINGELHFRSKGRELHPEVLDKMFNPPVNYIISIGHILPDNTIFYGEILNKPKHNVLAYERTPRNGIALFGCCDASHTTFYCHNELTLYAKIFDIDVVPLVYEGSLKMYLDVMNLMDRESYLGATKVEGLVVKNYTQAFLLGGQPIPFMAGKLVSEKFKEVAKGWSKDNTSKGKWQSFVESFKTEARWEKGVQHLRDDGKLTVSLKDIGPLIKEVQTDIAAEEKENIKDFLWNNFGHDIIRNATAGIPQWYKEKLLKDSMNE